MKRGKNVKLGIAIQLIHPSSNQHLLLRISRYNNMVDGVE